MKVSDIFHLIQYRKTEIKLEKHNSVKTTASTFLHPYMSLMSCDRQISQCLESMSEANWKELFSTRSSYKYKLQVSISTQFHFRKKSQYIHFVFQNSLKRLFKLRSLKWLDIVFKSQVCFFSLLATSNRCL